jgi:hypothetical protein
MIIEKPRHNHSAGVIARNGFTEVQVAAPVLRPGYGSCFSSSSSVWDRRLPTECTAAHLGLLC